MKQEYIDKLPEKFEKIGLQKSMAKHLQNLKDKNIIHDFHIIESKFGNDLTIWFNEKDSISFVPDWDGRCRAISQKCNPLNLINTEYFNNLNSGLPNTGHGYGRNE